MEVPRVQYNKSFNCNFKGIFVNEKQDADFKTFSNEYIGHYYTYRNSKTIFNSIKTADYYPFKDESEDEIIHAVNRYVKNREYRYDNINEVCSVDIKENLPYTEKEVNDFMKKNSLNKEEFGKLLSTLKLMEEKGLDKFSELFKFFKK